MTEILFERAGEIVLKVKFLIKLVWCLKRNVYVLYIKGTQIYRNVQPRLGSGNKSMEEYKEIKLITEQLRTENIRFLFPRKQTELKTSYICITFISYVLVCLLSDISLTLRENCFCTPICSSRAVLKRTLPVLTYSSILIISICFILFKIFCELFLTFEETEKWIIMENIPYHQIELDTIVNFFFIIEDTR